MTELVDATFEQTRDSIIAMTSHESSSYVVHDYLARLMMEPPEQQRRYVRRRPGSSSPEPPPSSSSDAPPPPVDAPCRYLMAKWCNSLCDFCHYPRDLTASAMSCVDRFVATSAGYEALLDRDYYQLAVMTAFYTTAKVHQLEALDPKSVARLSRGKHSKKDIEEMELTMLVALGWRVNPPTTRYFAYQLLQLIPESLMDCESRKRVTELTELQLDLAVCDYDLSLYRPSQIAFGGLLNAMESLDAEFAVHFESMVSAHVLTASTNVEDLREVRIGLLRAVSEDPSAAEPMSALLTKQLSTLGVVPASKPAINEHQTGSSIAVNNSPRCVSLMFGQ
jgi:hypothetical protein